MADIKSIKVSNNISHETGPPRKKRKKNPSDIAGPKNPVLALNEIKPNLVYNYTERGPAHAKIFEASIIFNGQCYTAEDTTKKKAKARVAQMILHSAVQLKDPTIKPPLPPVGPTAEDFSEDLINSEGDGQDFFSFESTIKEQVTKAAPAPALISPKRAAQSSPSFQLNLLKPGIKIEIVKDEGEPHCKKYTARVTIDDVSYEGVGTSKKQAKNEAAQNALCKAFERKPMKPLKSAITKSDSNPQADFIIGDYVAKLVETTYADVTKNEEPVLARYKVLAGVVMSWGPKVEESKVISIGTGSKCINGGHLSLDGEAVNDCHAEVLARRGLLSFLYTQLEEYTANPADSIFEPADNGNPFLPRLKLKPNILFHIYVSSAPCGDARIFMLNEANTPSLQDPHPNRQGRGVLRTKIESGEGTVPINETTIQTWDGILQGERLLTMSCSDKMARWNVLGVQGSLLSHILNPIYFHTVVVGSLYHPVHLHRALIGRIEHLQGLPSPFYLARPTLTSTSYPPDRMPSKSPKHSICWTLGWPQCEMIDIVKGKLMDGSLSRLCKRRFLESFITLAAGSPEWRRMVIDPHLRDGRVEYRGLKKAAREFGEAKEMLQSLLVVARMGQWVKKPLEQDGFELAFEAEQSPDDHSPSGAPQGF